MGGSLSTRSKELAKHLLATSKKQLLMRLLLTVRTRNAIFFYWSDEELGHEKLLKANDPPIEGEGVDAYCSAQENISVLELDTEEGLGSHRLVKRGQMELFRPQMSGV